MGGARPGTEGEGVYMERAYGFIYTRTCIFGSFVLPFLALPMSGVWSASYVERGIVTIDFAGKKGGITSGGISHVEDASQDATRTGWKADPWKETRDQKGKK